MEIQSYSPSTRGSSIYPERVISLQTAHMQGLVFIRTSGTFLAHAPQYWQRSAAHSAPREANITSYLLLSDGSSPAPACLLSNLFPPAALLLFLPTAPVRTGLIYRTCNLEPALCGLHLKHLLPFVNVHQSTTDVCWDTISECLEWTNSAAVELWVGSLSSLPYLKETGRLFFIHEVICGSRAVLLI